MGQKVHPYGFRLVSIRKPRSRWFAEGAQYRQQLIEDIKIRDYIGSTQRNAGISNIVIDRTAGTVSVTIEAARPGIMIGRGGRDVDRLRQRLEKLIEAKVRVNVEETPEPDSCAQLVAENIAWQIERRVAPRRAMGQAMDRALERGAEGIRCEIAGRIGGAESARREKMGPEGRVPLHTLRADIDYGVTNAKTGYGNIGVKVWIYKGDILPPKKKEERDVWEELEAEAERLEHGAAVVVEEPSTTDTAPEPVDTAAVIEEIAVEEPSTPDTAPAPADSVIAVEEIAVEESSTPDTALAPAVEEIAVEPEPAAAEDVSGEEVSAEEVAEENSDVDA